VGGAAELASVDSSYLSIDSVRKRPGVRKRIVVWNVEFDGVPTTLPSSGAFEFFWNAVPGQNVTISFVDPTTGAPVSPPLTSATTGTGGIDHLDVNSTANPYISSGGVLKFQIRSVLKRSFTSRTDRIHLTYQTS